MFKKCIVFLFVTLIIFTQTFTFNVYANNNLMQTTIDEEEIIIDEDEQNNLNLRHVYDYTWHEIERNSEKIDNIFIEYHPGTPSWVKTDGYTINSGQTYSVSTSYEYLDINMNLEFSYSYNVEFTISANSNKYSKLGVYADYEFTTVTYEQRFYGKPTGRTKTKVFKRKKDSTMKVIYK